MSEYLNKKTVLEWLDDRRYKSPWIESFRERLESGAFDIELVGIEDYYALQDEHRQALKKIRRLRATLEQIRKNELATYLRRTLSYKLADEALSGELVRDDITEVYVVRNIEKDILYVGLDWQEVEGLLAEDASREYFSYILSKALV